LSRGVREEEREEKRRKKKDITTEDTEKHGVLIRYSLSSSVL
jgi:hypothetical protein